MLIDDASDLFYALQKLNLIADKPPFWWPKYGTFEVVVGAILTQNTQWSKVEKSLDNLRNNNLISLEGLAHCDRDILQEHIKVSGLYKTKAKYLQLLAQSILETFGDFETFFYEVNRDYLLDQKGVGFESADAILSYACKREEVLVVDAYSARLLEALGFEFEAYHEIQSWLSSGVKAENGNYAIFHGMIVAYCKANSKGKKVMIEALNFK